MDDSSDDDLESKRKKFKMIKNPAVDTSFLPDRDREEEENKLREELRQVRFLTILFNFHHYTYCIKFEIDQILPIFCVTSYTKYIFLQNHFEKYFFFILLGNIISTFILSLLFIIFLF